MLKQFLLIYLVIGLFRFTEKTTFLFLSLLYVLLSAGICVRVTYIYYTRKKKNTINKYE